MSHAMSEMSYESEAEIDAIESLALELMKPGKEFYPFNLEHLVEAISEVSRLDYARIEGGMTCGDERRRGKGIYEAATTYWMKAARSAAESQIVRSRS